MVGPPEDARPVWVCNECGDHSDSKDSHVHRIIEKRGDVDVTVGLRSVPRHLVYIEPDGTLWDTEKEPATLRTDYPHTGDGLLALLADAFGESVDRRDVPMLMKGGLLHYAQCPCCDELGHGPFIDLGLALDDLLPDGWATRADGDA